MSIVLSQRTLLTTMKMLKIMLIVWHIKVLAQLRNLASTLKRRSYFSVFSVLARNKLVFVGLIECTVNTLICALLESIGAMHFFTQWWSPISSCALFLTQGHTRTGSFFKHKWLKLATHIIDKACKRFYDLKCFSNISVIGENVCPCFLELQHCQTTRTLSREGSVTMKNI